MVVYLSTYLPTYLPIYLSIYLSVCLSICLSARLKRSYSARHPQFLNLTTSKTKQVCETSSLFKVDNIKNEAILRDFLQKWKVEWRADGLVPLRLAIFPRHLCQVLRPERKREARSYKVLHLSRENILANLKISCSKMQHLSGNQRAALLTWFLVLRLPRKMF